MQHEMYHFYLIETTDLTILDQGWVLYALPLRWRLEKAAL